MAKARQDTDPQTDAKAKPEVQAAEAKTLQAIRNAIEPLAHIRLLDPSQNVPHASVGKSYLIQRCGQRTEITNADIEAARRVRAEDVTLAEARQALSVLAKLPNDYMVKDPTQPLYQFTGQDAQPFSITNGDIEAARKLC